MRSGVVWAGDAAGGVFPFTRRRHMNRLSFSVGVGVGISVDIILVDTNIIIGTIRVDLHTAVIAIVVDIKAGDRAHGVVSAGKHGGRREEKGVGLRSGAGSNPESWPRCQGGLENTVNAGNDMFVIGWQRPRPFRSL